jgi:hypothetical protein
MAVEATVSVSYTRADGTVISRSVRVTKSVYDKSPMATFRTNVKRRAIEAVNSVLGTSPDVKIETA